MMRPEGAACADDSKSVARSRSRLPKASKKGWTHWWELLALSIIDGLGARANLDRSRAGDPQTKETPELLK